MIKIKQYSDPLPSEITPRHLLSRRAAMGGLIGTTLASNAFSQNAPNFPKSNRTLELPGERITSKNDATNYNNFYEFDASSKTTPARLAQRMKTFPWSIEVGGMVHKPKVFGIEDILKMELVERVYRLRCVETWSMVIPWVGLPLKKLIDLCEPQGSAKYVSFETLADRSVMPGLRIPTLQWPYREGLRLDEANHDLTLLTVGMYGEALPNQNGGPIRIVVPWKYGFKSIKSIIKINLTENEPYASWNQNQPNEYGFYANVNPNVSHPRWSQARERRVGEYLRRSTLMFNGYGEQVAGLYSGMDLTRYY